MQSRRAIVFPLCFIGSEHRIAQVAGITIAQIFWTARIPRCLSSKINFDLTHEVNLLAALTALGLNQTAAHLLVNTPCESFTHCLIDASSQMQVVSSA